MNFCCLRPYIRKLKSENEAYKQQSVVCKTQLESVTVLSTAYKTQIDDKNPIISRLKLENSKERCDIELRDEETNFTSIEEQYNLLVNSKF